MLIELSESEKASKKFCAVIFHNNTTRTIHFGNIRQDGEWSSDYTMHQDAHTRKNYISRHSKNNENWKFDIHGIKTPGFWSRWLLWEKKTYVKSLKNITTKMKNKIPDIVIVTHPENLLQTLDAS